ncbi:helix-turn-helix domain-containing protein, partial [Intestinimonas butyriciproducens]|uniref:helix-turn-helix domain-containing protein n=2 Tax=Intestinimonas TaxID=1392389 RepID=UPI0034A28C1C
MEGTAVERTSGIAGEQSLAERVNAYILTQHSSIHAVAKEVGYSRTSVSRYLSGKYDSCAASLEEKLAEFLEAHTGEAVEVPARGGAQRGGEPPR